MIHTKKFTLLNYPKTGSTFLRDAIAKTHRKLLGRKWDLVPNFCRPHLWYAEKLIRHPVTNIIDQHGFRRFVDESVNCPMVSVCRNPIDWFLSSYKYQLWAKNSNKWSAQFPNFPNLSHEEYNELRQLGHDAEWDITPRLDQKVGWQSQYFIRFYASKKLLKNLKSVQTIDDLINASSEDFAPIRFLRTERLVQEFSDFLKDLGYSSDIIQQIQSMPKLNTSKNNLGLKEELPVSMKVRISEQEWVLYSIRLQLGIDSNE